MRLLLVGMVRLSSALHFLTLFKHILLRVIDAPSADLCRVNQNHVGIGDAGSRKRSASGSRREGWGLEHARPVFDELDAAVEGAVVDHVECDVGIAIVDALRAGGTGNHGEHDNPEAIDDPGAQQRAGQADAAECAEDAGAILLHRPDRLHGVAAHEGGVGPREGRFE